MAHIHVNCTDEELAEFRELARTCRTSVAALGQHAIRQLLISARSGATVMVEPCTVEKAEFKDNGSFGITLLSPRS